MTIVDDPTAPVVIFRQGGNNLRIGNTLVWVVAAYAWCQKHGFTFFFPAAQLSLGRIIDGQSALLRVPESFGSRSVWGSDLANSYNVAMLDKFMNRNVVSATELSIALRAQESTVSILPSILACITDSSKFDWASSETVRFIASHRATIVNEPFPFRNHGLSDIAHYEADLLKPSAALLSLLAETPQSGETAVGIHIRQTDYSRWQGGRFYKDNVFYNELIEMVHQHLPAKSVLFVAHDGEFVADKKIRNLENVRLSGGSASEVIQDFARFVTCDFIIGPASTFTAQAARLRRLWLDKACGLVGINPDCSLRDTVQAFISSFGSESQLCR